MNPVSLRLKGFTIAGRILFANCLVVSTGAFASPWVVQQFSDESHFVLGTVLFTGGLLVSLPVNYLAVKLALKPLRRLSLAMEEVQRANLDTETDIGGGDHQIALLSDSYKTMLEWVREDRQTIEKLSRIDPLTEVGNTRALCSGLETDNTLAALKHYRFGGDEFVVIAPHTSLAGAKILAERLDEAVMNLPFTTHDGKLLRGTSVGQVRTSVGYAS